MVEYLLNEVVIFVFFVHKKYSRSFVKLRLKPWCQMDCFTEVLPTFLSLGTCQLCCCLCRVSSRNSSKISSFVFWRWTKVLRVWTTWGCLMTIYIFGWTIPLRRVFIYLHNYFIWNGSNCTWLYQVWKMPKLTLNPQPVTVLQVYLRLSVSHHSLGSGTVQDVPWDFEENYIKLDITYNLVVIVKSYMLCWCRYDCVFCKRFATAFYHLIRSSTVT